MVTRTSRRENTSSAIQWLNPPDREKQNLMTTIAIDINGSIFSFDQEKGVIGNSTKHVELSPEARKYVIQSLSGQVPPDLKTAQDVHSTFQQAGLVAGVTERLVICGGNGNYQEDSWKKRIQIEQKDGCIEVKCNLGIKKVSIFLPSEARYLFELDPLTYNVANLEAHDDTIDPFGDKTKRLTRNKTYDNASLPAEEYSQVAKSSQFQLLSPIGENVLLIRASLGDRSARERLIWSNVGLVIAGIKHFEGLGYPRQDDAFSEGIQALMIAIDHFDITRIGTSGMIRISTSAVRWIARDLLDCYRHMSKVIRIPDDVQMLLAKISGVIEKFLSEGQEVSTKTIVEELLNSEKRKLSLKSKRHLFKRYTEVVTMYQEGITEPASLDKPVEVKGGIASLHDVIPDKETDIVRSYELGETPQVVAKCIDIALQCELRQRENVKRQRQRNRLVYDFTRTKERTRSILCLYYGIETREDIGWVEYNASQESISRVVKTTKQMVSHIVLHYRPILQFAINMCHEGFSAEDIVKAYIEKLDPEPTP